MSPKLSLSRLSGEMVTEVDHERRNLDVDMDVDIDVDMSMYVDIINYVFLYRE